ncbi:MAG TPA: transcriptional regulator [Pyrinomonadaceae bacterium]|nr:transcriptional regulator [Pyrinomonadaceae bacterium]HWP54828.1 transcriptional regulator [Pyrinomonadaceae bacterium]
MAKQAALRREISKDQSEKQKLQGVHGGAPHSAHEIDRMIHERLRLGIISALAVNESLTFNELKHTVKTTDGNLSVHARKLEDAGYINCSKSFEGRTPKTEYSLTTAGRRALERYLDHMEALIGRMRKT